MSTITKSLYSHYTYTIEDEDVMEHNSEFRSEGVNDIRPDLSHDEMVSLSMFHTLEDLYQVLDKEQKDAVVMLLIEHSPLTE